MKTKQKCLTVIAGIVLAALPEVFAGNEQGIDYYRAELYGAAKIFFLQQTGQSASDQAENYYYLGQTYYKLGQKDSAQYYYDKSITADAEYPFGYIGTGTLLLEKGDFKQAEELFKKATGLAKKDPSAPTAVAEAYIAYKKYNEAADALKKAKKIDKTYSGIWITEGDMLMQQGKTGEATSDFDMAIRFNPSDKSAYLNCARVYKKINPDEALNYLQQALNVDQEYIPAYAEIGDINFTKGRNYKADNDTLNAGECYEKALAAYEKFISVQGVPLIQRERYAQLLVFTKQYDKAQAEIESVLAEDPSNIVMHWIRPYNNLALNNNDLALEQMKSYLELVPAEKHLYEDYMTLGDIYLAKLQYGEAEESYEKAMKIEPSRSAELYGKLILAAEDAKDFPTVITYWEKYFEVNPDFPTLDLYKYGRDIYYAAAALANEETAAAEANNPTLADENAQAFSQYIQKGDKAFADMIERKPDLYYGYQWRADLNALQDYYNMFRKKTVDYVAKPYYEAAIAFNTANNENGERNKDLITGYNYLAKYAIDKEDLSACIEYQKKILEIDPNNTQAQNSLKKLLDFQQKRKAAAAAKARAAAAEGL